MNVDSIATTSIPGFKWPVGIAYVAIPTDVERATYIRECYLNNYVSLWAEDGGFYNRVPCDIDLFNWIEFPKTSQEFGTALCYIVETQHQQPIVIGRLRKPNEIGDMRENQFRLSRRLGNKIVEISGSPDNNSLNLIVNSAEEEGSLNIVLRNSNDNGQLNLLVDGDIDIQSTGAVTLSQKKEILIETGESVSYQQIDNVHKFSGEKILINEGENPGVLGNQLLDFLRDLIKQIAAIKALSPTGPLPIINAPEILLLEQKLENILSKEIFLNK